MNNRQESNSAHYDDTPGPRNDAPPPPPPMSDGQEESGTFSQLLEKHKGRIANLLPNDIQPERFFAAAHSAVRQNPDLLNCTQRSLFNALTKAAQDGLLPDGREGIITSYSTKQKVKNASGGVSEQWLPTAQWSPMLWGIRKRARELDGLIIDAQVVHEKDHFVWEQGDNPRIEHIPAKLGTPRGELIGCYAVFKRENGTVIHREVMDKEQVLKTKEQSKAQTSLMWTKFESEGWRKAVVRRGSKTVPVSNALTQIIQRDDDAFEFDQRHQPISDRPAISPPSPPPAPAKTPPAAPRQIEVKTGITLDIPPAKPAEPVEIIRHEEPERNISAADQSMGAEEAYQDWLGDVFKELEQCMNAEAVEELRERILAELRPGDVPRWKEACADRATAVFKGSKKPR